MVPFIAAIWTSVFLSVSTLLPSNPLFNSSLSAFLFPEKLAQCPAVHPSSTQKVSIMLHNKAKIKVTLVCVLCIDALHVHPVEKHFEASQCLRNAGGRVKG